MSSLFSPRISLQDLAALCRRLGIALASGIEVRRVFDRERTESSGVLLRRHVQTLSDAVSRGDSLTEGLERTGDYFPPLLHEMVDVGEHTGHLAEVFRHLADHYQEQLKLRRTFLSSITMPMIQLVLAIAIVGVMILVLGMIGNTAGGKPTDILGLGLIGPSGFVTYCVIVGGIAAGVVFLIQAMRRGLVWTAPLQKAVLQIPGLGGPLRTISLAQMAWTMDLTLDAGMDLLKAMPLCLRSTHNAYYTDHTDQVVFRIRAGHEVHEALAETGAFPFEFLAAVEVGEQSGRLPESMNKLAQEYHDRARLAVNTLTIIAGWVVWGMVAMLIISMIIRIFSSYVNVLNDALKM